MPGCRKWTLCLNNYTEEDFISWKTEISNNCVYGVIGKEKGEKCETPHFQAYVEYKNPRRFNTMKAIYGDKTHLEPKTKKCTNTHSAGYCKKGEQSHEEWKKDGMTGVNYGKGACVWEHGTLVEEHQGSRSDLKAVAEAVKEDDNNIRELIEHDIIINKQGLDVAEKLMKYYETPREDKPEVWWLWGESGTGKTKGAHDLCKYKPWVSKGDLRWFDGYDAHEDVIIDDFRIDHVEFSTLLRLLDRYEFSVPIKGSFRQWKPKRIFITTPKSIRETYSWMPSKELKQLIRRVDCERHISADTKVAEVIL
jgi:hypothetical protein